MKKRIYIGVFIITGMMVGAAIAGGIEFLVLKTVIGKTTVPASEFVTLNYILLRRVMAAVFIIGGGLLAVWAAPRCWQMLYIEKRFGTPWL